VEGETGGLPHFFGIKLGPSAKWIAVVADLIILYGVLTAYLTGVTSILVNLVHTPLPPYDLTLAYFIIVAGLTSFGMGILRRCNAIILITMAVTFLVLVVMTTDHVQLSRVLPARWGFLPAAMPVVLTAFLYHNLIPNVCRELEHDRKAIRKALFTGSAIGLVMNLVWTAVVFCALPMTGPGENNILYAFKANQPATIPLSKLLGSAFFTDVGLVFAILAMTAAFMANGMALRAFLLDLTVSYLRIKSRVLVWVLAFVPPLLVSLFYPDIFLVAMNVVGGIGVCIIFGILPGILLLRGGPRGSRGRLGGVIMLVAFGLILIFELCQEFHLTHIHPDVEYWTAAMK